MKLFPQNKFSKAFIITVIYVGLGTLSVCSVYPSDPFYGEWSLFGLIMTVPVTVISFSYRFAESKDLLPVFIIQTIMLMPTYLFVRFVILKDKKKVIK